MIWATWTAFRDQPEIVVLRVVFSLIIATLIGWIFSSQADLKPFLQPGVAASLPRREVANPPEGLDLLRSGTFLLDQPGQPLRFEQTLVTGGRVGVSDRPKPLGDRLRLLLDNTIQELRELGGILVLGSLLAAIIQVAVPREIILNLGQGPVSSIVTMMTLGGVISICSTVDAFFCPLLFLHLYQWSLAGVSGVWPHV